MSLVTEITEANYFFRLRKYQDWLIDFLKKNENFVFPRYRQKLAWPPLAYSIADAEGGGAQFYLFSAP